MGATIKIRRGLAADRPTVASAGELLYDTDDQRLYVGTGAAVVRVGIDGTNGTNGANGTNGFSVRNGSGAPGGGLGVDGDFYIDTTGHLLYGPKASGAWGSGVSLVGPAGTNGTNGANGANGANGNTVLHGSGAPGGGVGVNGDFYLDTATENLYGPKTGGAWGSPVSLIGPAGSSTLAGDTDVLIVSPTDQQILAYDGSSAKWKNSAPISGANVNGDTHPASPVAGHDDEFEGVLLSGIWTNWNTTPFVLKKGSLTISLVGSGGPINWRFLTQTPPSAPYTIAAKMVQVGPPLNYSSYGLFLYESGTGKIIQFGGGFADGWGLALQRYTNSSTYLSTTHQEFIAYAKFPGGLPPYLAIRDDGTNFNYLYSYDGITFQLWFSETRTAFLAAYDAIGFGFDCEFTNTMSGAFSIDWFRKIA